jgi:hypothetical protein
VAAISTNARRLPGPIVAVIGSLLFVAIALLILRIVFDPNEESIRTSAEAARPRRVAVSTRTQASTATTTAAATTPAPTDALPSLGDTLVAVDGLGVTMVAVEDFSMVPQRQGSPFRPRKDLIRIVTIEFENGSADPTTVVNTNIMLLRPDGSRIVVDARSLNVLNSKPAGLVESRPLFLAESIAAGRSIIVSVSFDVEQSDDDFRLDIEGLRFAMPAINLLDEVAAEVETEAESEPEATPVAEDVRDTRAGSSRDTTENRGRARIEAVEQTAVSRTGVATLGDTQLGDDGLEVTLVSVQQFEELTQVHGSPFRPKNGAFKLVTIQFTNTNDSGNIVVSKANIVLIEPSGNEIAVSSPGVNALIGMATTATEGRPLFLVESVPDGKTAVVAVVFDVAPDLVDLEIDIEGFIFEVPNP